MLGWHIGGVRCAGRHLVRRNMAGSLPDTSLSVYGSHHGGRAYNCLSFTEGNLSFLGSSLSEIGKRGKRMSRQEEVANSIDPQSEGAGRFSKVVADQF